VPKPSSPKTQHIYQLKVTLRYVKPPIWRRILVPGDVDLGLLHEILQMAMGWVGGHLHAFSAAGIGYSIPDEDDIFGGRDLDERTVTLSAVAPAEKSRLTYEYDFGDGWKHDIAVEKILPREEGKRYPVCTAGKRACPPEDCGGPWGYGEFLEAIRNPKHADHKMWTEWIGGSFDPEAFDLDETNKGLATIKLVRRRRRRIDYWG
jgi:hypothetical protein